MYGVAAASTVASTYVFISYIILVTLLFGNLFLGVIIDIYAQIEKVQSINLHETLEITFSNLSDDESRVAFELLCDLLKELGKLPDPFGAIRVMGETKQASQKTQASSDKSQRNSKDTDDSSCFGGFSSYNLLHLGSNPAGMYGDTSIGGGKCRQNVVRM